jgi:hypothetical protein
MTGTLLLWLTAIFCAASSVVWALALIHTKRRQRT